MLSHRHRSCGILCLCEIKETYKSEFVTLFGGELVMIKLKMSIEDISEYQTGILPKNAVK